jgi:energy-coupling factor transport system ATP-binding protein
VIEVREATYRYVRTAAPVIVDASMSVAGGETVAIVGPNGSGKSTMGRLMKGLLLPTTGSVVVDGLDTRAASLDVRRLVGLVFQNPTSQIVNAVVEQEVAFGPENLALPPDDIRRRVESALAAVHLQGLEEAECHALSMANRQRVAIASVIAMEPRYLVLDEPTAFLEPTTRRPVLEQVLRWGEANGVAVVIITHRMDEAQLCGRVVGMLDGRIAAEGPAREVLSDADVRFRLSLDVPETLQLAEDLRARGLPVRPGASIETLSEQLTGDQLTGAPLDGA